MEDSDAISQIARPDIVVTDSPTPGVRRITLNRPEKLNTMNLALIVGLEAALESAAADHGCRVVILTGAGRGFCAGLDLGGYG